MRNESGGVHLVVNRQLAYSWKTGVLSLGVSDFK